MGVVMRSGGGRLIPRKRIDIGVRDLLRGVGLCLRSPDASTTAAQIERSFGGGWPALACLSVRTGFDLVLQALALRPGDEVLMSGFTIPHMPAIVCAHGAVPVPIDLDEQTMAPDWAAMAAAVTPRTRAIVVAHLFGGRVDVTPGVALARTRGLCFVEDAAQAFDHGPWRGHPRADVTLFSFGPIKTATALGGGLAVVRDRALEQRMRTVQADYPRRPDRTHAAKVIRYLAMGVLSRPRVYGAAALLARSVGVDFDATINAMTRSFRGRDLLAALRWRPAAAHLGLLAWRLSTPTRSCIVARRRAGVRVAHALPPTMRLLGGDGAAHGHALFPVVTAEPDRLVTHLRRAGFDATRGGSILAPVRSERGGVATVERFCRQLAYLPVDGHLDDRDLERLIAALAAYPGVPVEVPLGAVG